MTPDPIPDATLDLWEVVARCHTPGPTRVVALIAEVRRLRAELTYEIALTAAFIREVKRLQDETKERQP